MQKNYRLSPPVMSVDGDLPQPSDNSSAAPQFQRADGTILALPPGREQITADIRTINRQCFLMLCDTHSKLLVSLAQVPTKLVFAARSLIQMNADEHYIASWTKTLSHYLECLTGARSQIGAAARLHGLADRGQETLKDIEVIEATLPLFLRAASDSDSCQEEIKKLAEQLGNSSIALTKSLEQLLRAVESAMERARLVNPSDCP